MAVGNWAEVDYYAVLGVEPDATDDEIARAFRSLAKQLHPDVGPQLVDDNERFTLAVAAYDVLSDSHQRYDYDDVRTSVLAARQARERMAAPVAVDQSAARKAGAPMINWTPRKAVATIAAGMVCVLLGIAFTIFILALQARERADRAGRVRVQATAVIDGNGRTHLTFVTASGGQVTVPEPTRVDPGVLHDGDTLTLLYKPTQPSNVIVDETHFGRDFTFWFIAVKLIVCGPVITAIGVRKRSSLRYRARNTVHPVPVPVPA